MDKIEYHHAQLNGREYSIGSRCAADLRLHMPDLKLKSRPLLNAAPWLR